MAEENKETKEVVEENPYTIESMDGKYEAEIDSDSVTTKPQA